jgi:hypothetical protein
MHHDRCTPFHTANWARVLCESYGYKPRYVAALGNDRFDAVLPVLDVESILTGRRGVSLPFSDLCEPLADSENLTKQLFNSALELGRQNDWRYYELRAGCPLNLGVEPSARFLEHVLRLDSEENALFRRFDKNTRRAVKRATSNGVTVTLSRSLGALRAYHHLNAMTRRQHGLPPQPWSFFANVHKHLISQHLGFISLALHENRPIAGSVYFHFKQRAFYKFAASHPKHTPLCAGFASAWAAIRWYARNGYKSLSFGRTEPDNGGLRRFKLGWGTEERPIAYYRCDLRGSRTARAQPMVTGPHNAVFRKLPLTVSRCIGSVLYRHMG